MTHRFDSQRLFWSGDNKKYSISCVSQWTNFLHTWTCSCIKWDVTQHSSGRWYRQKWKVKVCTNIAVSFPGCAVMEIITYLQLNRAKSIDGKRTVTMTPSNNNTVTMSLHTQQKYLKNVPSRTNMIFRKISYMFQLQLSIIQLSYNI